jgi:hypothetical protein
LLLTSTQTRLPFRLTTRILMMIVLQQPDSARHEFKNLVALYSSSLETKASAPEVPKTSAHRYQCKTPRGTCLAESIITMHVLVVMAVFLRHKFLETQILCGSRLFLTPDLRYLVRIFCALVHLREISASAGLQPQNLHHNSHALSF